MREALMKLSIKNIFFIDGVGALLSFVVTSLILPFFSRFIGVPSQILWILGIIAFFLALYSLFCYFYLRDLSRGRYLKALIFMNLLYVVIIGGLLSMSTTATVYGSIYFILEAIIILSLVFVEYKVLQNHKLKGPS